MWEYLTEPTGFNWSQSPTLGLFVFWIFVLIACFFWLRAKPPKNAARLAFRKRTAYGMIAFAVLGIAQIIAKSFEVPVLNWRLTTLLILFGFLAFAGFAFWDLRTRLKERAASAGRVDKVVPKHITAPGSVPAVPPTATEKAEPITARRDARRSKKRKR